MKTLTLTPTVAARYERRNAKRRKVHLANADMRAACGSLSERLTFSLINDSVTCETCREIAAKGGAL